MTMFKSSAKQLSTALFAAGLSLSAANSNAWTYALGDYNSNYSYSGIPLSMADDVAVSSELLNKLVLHCLTAVMSH